MDSGSETTQSYIWDVAHNTIVLVVLSIFITLILYYRDQMKDLPPGPIGVPFLGYWPFLSKENCHLQLLDLKKKYGDIFSFTVTGKLFVNLASFKVLREAHVTKTDYFTERTSTFNILGLVFGGGIVYANGEKWTTLRKYFLNQLRDRGMTAFKQHTADSMNEIISSTIEELRKNANKPLDIIKVLLKNGNSIIRQTLLGPDTPVTEKEVKFLQENYSVVTSLNESTNMVLAGNFAKYFIMPFLVNYKEGVKCHRMVKQSIQRIIDDHKRTFDGDNVRDVIDAYIKERNERRSKGDPTVEYFTDEALVVSLLQFIGDGVANVAFFITFFLTALLDHPEEQDKIYNELVEVVGEDRNAGLDDKSKLTYTNAFLLEAQRTANFVPIFPSLECTRDTTVGGYKIPKGAMTVMNVYAIHNDPKVYENPEKFDPTRFLSKPGKPKPESPITFGVGKRVCLGEAFVMMQVFLICTAIVKNFRLQKSNNKSVHDIFLSRTLDIIFVPRK